MGSLFQGTNYMVEPPNILPMPILDKITIQFSFIKDLSAIFNMKPSFHLKKVAIFL